MVDILELTVKKLRALLESGEITSFKLVSLYMERIAQIDRSGPTLNSILEFNPDALDIADAMDRERAKKKLRSPLHGIPILIKDNLNTKDKMRTTAGSIALADNFAPYDSTVAARLRKAGLVIMGKTNMTELANYMSVGMENGYSSRGGQVMNPYNPQSTVWGSSSGSAVAMAANLCMLSIGTETDGSILWPSDINSVVGIKPTHGLVSRHGIIPICTGQDIAGPMARTVEDCAALLNVIAGEDENDPSTISIEDKIPGDYTDFLDKDGLKGLRVGINRGYYADFSQSKIKVIEAAYSELEKCGATLVQDVNLPHLRCDASVLLYEFKKCLNAYLATTNCKCRSLKDMIDYYGDHPGEGLKYGMTILQKAEYETSGNCTEEKYLLDRLAALRKSRQDGLDKVLDDHKLDLLISPGASDLAPISGYPGITVPAGYDDENTPIGLGFIGRAFTEPLLIQAAYAFEQATHLRKQPVFGKTAKPK